MENKKLKNERRRFFSLLGKGALGLSLISILPKFIFGQSNNKSDLVKIKIHPSAIKRTK